MTLTLRSQMFAGMAAATLCWAPMAAPEVSAQSFRQRTNLNTFHNPYGGGYNTGFYNGQRYGYTGYGQGVYGHGARGGYVYPSTNTFRQGTFHNRGTYYRPSNFGRSYIGRGSHFYSPYGFRSRF